MSFIKILLKFIIVNVLLFHQSMVCQNNISGPEVNSTDYENIFFKVFGYKEPKPENLLIPFYLDKKLEGKIHFLLDKNKDAYYFIKKDLFHKLENYVNPDILQKVFYNLSGYNKIYFSDLNDNGFETDFNEKMLFVEIRIPPEFRIKRTIDFGLNKIPDEYSYAIRPNSFSSYLNLRTFEEVRSGRENYYDIERMPVSLHFDSAVNIKKFVLEGNGNYNESTQWSRNDIRIVYDNPQKMIRYYAGDINYPTKGFQSSISMGGVGFSKDFNLQPYFSVKPISSEKIMILRDSKLEIYSNNVLVNKFEVEPGPFDLRKVSVKNGLNNITVKIIDDLGEETFLDIDNYYNDDQLGKGISQYSFNAGVERNTSNGYSDDKTAFSMFYRQGLNNVFTGGINAQVRESEYLGGIECSLGSIFGNINFDFAAKSTDLNKFDYFYKTSYSYFNNDLSVNPHSRQWRAVFEHSSEYLFSGSVSQNLFNDLNSSLGGTIGSENLKSSIKYLLTGNLMYRINSKLKLSCGITYDNFYSQDQLKTSLMITYIPVSNNYINSKYNSFDRTSNTNWNYRSDKYNFTNGFSFQNSEDIPLSLNNRISFSGNRGVASFEASHTELSDNEKMSSLKMSTGTGMVFVGGCFGFSKPVGNSFALIKSDNVLKKYLIGIEKCVDGDYRYKSDFMGSAVHSSLSPYKIKKINVDTPDIPLGYKITGSGEQVVLPYYKSGFLIEVEAEENIYARGKIVDEKNEPFMLKRIKVKLYGKSDEDAFDVFTNKSGYFSMNEVKPGNYELVIDDKSYKKINFKISATKKNYFNIGVLQLRKIDSDSD